MSINKKILIIFILILVVASALRFYKLHYGIAGSYVADTQTVSEAMDIGTSLAGGHFSVFTKPVKYPFILPYLILFLHGIYFAGGKILGVFHNISDFLRFIALNQGFSFLIARLISIFAGIAAIILSFFVARLLAKRLGLARFELAALVSSFFISFSLLLVQFSRLERPHIVVGFFILLSYFLYLRFLEKPSIKNGIWLGIGVGLAAGTLQSGILAGIFLFLPLIFYFLKKRKEHKNIWGGFLSAAVLFLLSYPFLFLSFKRALGLSSGKFDVSLSGAAHNVFPFGGKGFYEILHSVVLYDPALFILFLVSIIIWGFKKKLQDFFRADSWGFIGFCFIFLIAFGLYDFTLPRYTIPLVVMLAAWSGPLAISLFGQNETASRTRVYVIIFLCLLGLFSLIQVFRMTYLLKFPDTRDLATDWLRQNTTKTETILLTQNIISLPPTKSSILENQKLGGILDRRDGLLLSLPDSKYPTDAKNILRDWQLSTTDYRGLIQKNKIKYIVFSDESGFRNFNDPLFVFAGNNLKLKTSFSPFIRKNDFLYSTFPGDFHDPILELWGIKQMGPEVRIYSTN